MESTDIVTEIEQRPVDKFSAVVGKIVVGTSWISFAGMMIMVGLVVVDIILRVVSNTTIYGVYDWVCFMMIPVGFFALGLATWNEEHVSVTIITDKLSPGFNKVLELINYCIAIALTVILAWRSIVQAGVSHAMGTKAIEFPLHTFWFYYVIGAGYILFTLVLVLQTMKHVINWRKPE
jgi:TRAP-type C4-dicarboxylate transport system permease small subunit